MSFQDSEVFQEFLDTSYERYERSDVGAEVESELGVG